MHKKIFFSQSIYPWIVWVLSASFFYYKYLIQVSPGVMSSHLMNAYSLTGAGLGNLAACFFYGYLLMQIPVGILLDKWSPGKITSIAAVICALSIIVFANTDSLIVAGVSRFVTGVSASFAAVACFKLTSIWFPPKRFAFIAGLSMTAAMLGAIGGQGPLSLLINKFDWRYALDIVAIGGIILALLMWTVIIDKNIEHSYELVKPNNKIKWLSKLGMILKDKQTWLLSLYSGLAFAPVSVFGGLWGVSFLKTAYSLNVSQAANYVSFIFVGFAIGCPLAGWLSDYIGRRKPIMTLGTALGLISISLILYQPLSLKYVPIFMFFFGVGASGFFLCFSMIRELHASILTATVLGFMNTFDSFCEAVTEPFIGKLLDLSWAGTYVDGARAFNVSDYHYSLLVLLIYLGIALFLLVFIRETYCTQINNGEVYAN